MELINYQRKQFLTTLFPRVTRWLQLPEVKPITIPIQPKLAISNITRNFWDRYEKARNTIRASVLNLHRLIELIGIDYMSILFMFEPRPDVGRHQLLDLYIYINEIYGTVDF